MRHQSIPVLGMRLRSQFLLVIPYVGQLEMDCRHCHTFVDRSEHSNVPATDTCMSCHSMVRKNDPVLAQVRESYESGEAIPWVRIHKTPDYVYFNHAVHVNRGISCVECHGRIDQMEVVHHAKSLSMRFCLDCHRNPEEYIRPPEEVYNLAWERPTDEESQAKFAGFVHDWKVNPLRAALVVIANTHIIYYGF